MKIVCYKGRGRHPWRWQLVSVNGKIVGDSAEGYARRDGLTKAARRIQRALNGIDFIEMVWRPR